MGDFAQEMKGIARLVRTTLSSLMMSAGMDPHDPQVLTRKWGVNKTLSWKISKIVQTDDPFLALQQVPGREGMDVLLKKGHAAGVEPRFLEAARDAVEQLERLIEAHCGDRATFEIMAGDATPQGRQQREEHHRKQLFQGASYVWGVQARMYLNLRFVAPTANDPAKADIASVMGLLDFRRLRENVRWLMSRRKLNHDDGSPISLADFDPIDPASAGQVVPLMPEFCSHAELPLTITRDESSATAELTPDRVGNAGTLTYFAGAIERRFPNVRTAQDRVGSLWAFSNTPVELLMYDIYIHESLAHAIPPQFMLCSLLGPLQAGRSDYDRYKLPLAEQLVDLGPAVPAPVTPEVPRYGELLDAVFARAGWNASEFRAFRIKIAYPPIPTALIMQYPLPE